MAAARVERCGPQLKVWRQDKNVSLATSDLTSQSAPGRSRAHRPISSGSLLWSCWLELWSAQPRTTLFLKGRSLWVARRHLAFFAGIRQVLVLSHKVARGRAHHYGLRM